MKFRRFNYYYELFYKGNSRHFHFICFVVSIYKTSCTLRKNGQFGLGTSGQLQKYCRAKNSERKLHCLQAFVLQISARGV